MDGNWSSVALEVIKDYIEQVKESRSREKEK